MRHDLDTLRTQENGINFVEEIISTPFYYICLVRTKGIPRGICDEEANLNQQSSCLQRDERTEDSPQDGLDVTWIDGSDIFCTT